MAVSRLIYDYNLFSDVMSQRNWIKPYLNPYPNYCSTNSTAKESKDYY